MALLARVRRPHLLARGIVALSWYLGLSAELGEAQSPSDPVQQEIEAAYLLNFTRYVEWPARSFATSNAVLKLCVTGADEFRPILERTVAGRRARGRPLQVLAPEVPAAAGECHVIYIGGGRTPAAQWLTALENRPILTVGAGADFRRRGGMIAFVVVNGTVRFEIDAERARRAGLQISSRVLALATHVADNGSQP